MRRVLAAIVYVLVVAQFLSCTAMSVYIFLGPSLLYPGLISAIWSPPGPNGAAAPILCPQGELPHQIRDQ